MGLVSFDQSTQEVQTGVCGVSLGLPTFGITFGIPSPDGLAALLAAAARNALGLPPLPNLAFTLQCDPSKPVDISAGLPSGGGRTSNIGPDPTTSNDT